MTNDCLICAIINGTAAAYFVYENELFLAFLDSHPLFAGHTLLVPRAHHETLLDLPPAMGGALLSAVQTVGRAVQSAMQSQGLFVANNNIVSQSIAHLHVHLVPRNKGDGLKGFFWPRMRYRDEAHASAIQAAIVACL